MREKKKRPVLMSSCLLGYPVRYDGKGGRIDDDYLGIIQNRFKVLHFCPEVEGGLGTPRDPAEMVRGSGESGGEGAVKVMTCNGVDVTCQFTRGAEAALEFCRKEKVEVAVLKERSPSCGSHMVYDGTFTGKTIPGAGITAALLRENGIMVYSEENLEEFFSWAEGEDN